MNANARGPSVRKHITEKGRILMGENIYRDDSVDIWSKQKRK